jgi:hypothetical protein
VILCCYCKAAVWGSAGTLVLDLAGGDKVLASSGRGNDEPVAGCLAQITPHCRCLTVVICRNADICDVKN